MPAAIIPSQTEIKSRLNNSQREVKSWEDLHRVFSRMRDTAWVFRGVSSPDHYPIPSIGRENVFGPYKEAQEERLFREFKNRAISLMADTRLTEWDWLAFAQHLGVPTRLLDWTTSPLIAAFFALEAENENDRLIYGVKYSTYIHEVESRDISPFNNKKAGRYTPPLLFDRIRAQRGVFTIHPEPTKIFYKDKMQILRIPNKMVGDFRKKLFKYGFDYWHVFPDTEGLGLQLRWQFKNKIGLGSLFKSK